MFALGAARMIGGPLGRGYAAAAQGPPTANLWAWWKADSLVGFADGDPVSAWSDSGAGARNLSQSGSLRPLYRAGAIAGNPAVEFDGTDDYLTIANPGILAAVHVFLVASLTDATGSDRTVVGSGSGGFNFNLQQTNRRPLVSAYGFTTSSGTSAPGAATWFQANASIDGALGVAHRLNRTANGTGTLGSAPNSNTTRVGDVGAFGPRAFKGLIAELLIYSAALSTGDRDAVESYLNAKYGV